MSALRQEGADASGLSPPLFVGRERERARLIQAVVDRARVIVVEGEAGIGKTRLVDDALTDPVGGRYRVVTAWCPPVGTPFPLGAVIDAVRQAVVGSPGVVAGLSPVAGALRPLLPEWSDALPAALDPAEDAAADRHRVFRALAELLESLEVRVLVVEDVHWADRPTVEFLLFLAARQPSPLSLLVTWRPEDVRVDSLLDRLARLAAGSEGLRLSLQPLDIEATGRLAASMLGGPAPARLVAALHDRTDGVPLLVEESLLLLHESPDRKPKGRAARRGGRSDPAEWAGVPASVRDMVSGRVARLDSVAQEVLRAAAVLAAPSDEATIAAVSALDANQARAGLVAALSSSLLAEDDAGLVSFRHALAADAVYHAIPGPERRRLHARAGQALESATPTPLARLIRHFREAGDTSGWLRYGERAAEVALATGDETASETLLFDLITEAGLAPADAARLVARLRFAALTGEDRYRRLAEALRAALRVRPLEPSVEADVRWQLARVLMKSDDTAAACAEMERAIPHLDHDPSAAGHAMIRLAELSWASWPAATRLAWLRRGERLASVDDPVDRLDLLIDRAVALLRLGEPDGWTEAAKIPLAADDPRQRVRAARGLGNVGHFAVAWGRYQQARRLLSTALELAVEHGYERLRSGFEVTALHLDYFTGEWAGLADRAEALADSDDSSPGVRMEATLVAGLLQAAGGRAEAATQSCRGVLEDMQGRGVPDLAMEPAAALARVALAAGRVDDALSVTDEPLEILTSLGTWVWSTDLLPARVQALTLADRLGEARELVAACAAGLARRDAPGPLAGLATAQAILVGSTAGDPVESARAFAVAAEAWQGLPRPYDALLARERQAGCLLAVDKPAATAMLEDTLRGLTRLGAVGDVDRIVKVLRRHGVETRGPGWRGGRTGYGDRLSPRETEVVRLVIAGCSNREIAETLFRSPRTVETQVKSAMRKLHVSSRTALAVQAAAMDLTRDEDSRTLPG